MGWKNKKVIVNFYLNLQNFFYCNSKYKKTPNGDI